MGYTGVDQAPGGVIGSMEGGREVAGGGDGKLWTKHGKLLADVGIDEMVCSGGVSAPT